MSADAAVSTTPLEQKHNELYTVCEETGLTNERMIFVAETILTRLYDDKRPLPSMNAPDDKTIVLKWDEGTKKRKKERSLVIEDWYVRFDFCDGYRLSLGMHTSTLWVTKLFEYLDEFRVLQPSK